MDDEKTTASPPLPLDLPGAASARAEGGVSTFGGVGDRFQPAPELGSGAPAVVPADQKLYSWWSYRNRDWEISNRGRRLDHVWVSQDLAASLVSHQILKSARNWEQPSDHVPVAVTLEV